MMQIISALSFASRPKESCFYHSVISSRSKGGWTWQGHKMNDGATEIKRLNFIYSVNKTLIGD